MTNQTPTPDSQTQSLPSPLRCLTGALISGGIATSLYFVTAHIIQTFAAKPVHSDNVTVINLTAAVRTLVIGVSTLGTGIFGLAAIGLILLSIQVTIQQIRKQTPPASDA